MNVKDCNTYLYTFMSKFLKTDTVPLEWGPVQLLHGHVVLYQDASDSGNSYSIYVVDLKVFVSVASGDGLHCIVCSY